MCKIAAGDLVSTCDSDDEMLVIGRADDNFWEPCTEPAFFCVWEQMNFLREEVFPVSRLKLVRRERRRIPRGGELQFPIYEQSTPTKL